MSLKKYLPIFTTAIVWGLAFPLSKIVLFFMSPMILSLIRFLIGGAALLLVSRKILLSFKVFINSLLNIGIVITLLNIGLAITSDPAFASVILYSQPLFVLLISYLYLKQKISILQKIGTALALLGLIIGVGSYEIDLGVILILIAGFTWAVGTIYYRRNFYNQNLLALNSAMAFFSAFFVLPLLPIDYYFIPSIFAITLAILIGLLVQATGWALWFKSIDIIGTINTSLFSLLVPVFAYIFTFLIFFQIPNSLRILGSALVILGIFLSEYESYKFSKTLS